MSMKFVPAGASKPLFNRGGRSPGRPLTPPWYKSHKYFRRPNGTVYGITKDGLTKAEIQRRLAKGHVPLDDNLRPECSPPAKFRKDIETHG